MDVLNAIGGWPGAVWLHGSSTAYLFVNATHILGIALLLGSILPLDLRLMGCFRSVPLAIIGPFLTRGAAVGLTLALLTGLWLFSVNPVRYSANPAFLAKIGLLGLALANLSITHASGVFPRAIDSGRPSPALRIAAAVSFMTWLTILVAGRWIGFL